MAKAILCNEKSKINSEDQKNQLILKSFDEFCANLSHGSAIRKAVKYLENSSKNVIQIFEMNSQFRPRIEDAKFRTANTDLNENFMERKEPFFDQAYLLFDKLSTKTKSKGSNLIKLINIKYTV